MRRFAAVLALTSACSFATVQGAPAMDPGFRPVPCPRANVAPAFDAYVGGTLALTGAIFGLAYLGSSGEEGNEDIGIDPTDDFLIPGVIMGGLGAVLLFSAFDGFNKTRRCKS